MLTKIINVALRDAVYTAAPYQREYRGPCEKLCPLPDALTDAAFESFSLGNLHQVERVDDNSIDQPTFKVLNGENGPVRLAFHYPSGGHNVAWCVLTAPVDQVGYVVGTDQDLIQTLFYSLTKSPFIHERATLAGSKAEMEMCVDMARASFTERNIRDSGISREEALRLAGIMYDDLHIYELPVAADELKHHWINHRIARRRLGAQWGELIPKNKIASS